MSAVHLHRTLFGAVRCRNQQVVENLNLWFRYALSYRFRLLNHQLNFYETYP